jgi:hypothetical protein
MVSRLQKIRSGLFIPDPDPNFLPILDPGSWGQKGTGSRIRIRYTGYKIPLRNERRGGAARNDAEQVVPASNHSTAVPLYIPFKKFKT